MLALSCGADEALFGGAAGPGKTDVLIACGARYCQHPAARVLFLRTSYTDLQDVRDRMSTLYPAMGAVWESEAKRWRWPSGATLEMGYGETMAECGRYFGRQFTAILFDELGLLPEEVVWTTLMSRVRSTDTTVPLRMRASANPGGPGHAWLKSRFVTPTDRGRKIHVETFTYPDTGEKVTRTIAYVPGTALDNPSLPSTYWAGLAALPPSMRAALRDGDWDAGIGLFYPEVAGVEGERRMVPRETLPEILPEWWDFWAGYDWGHRHPAVFVALARDGSGRTIVLDTLYMHKMPDMEQAAQIRGLAMQPKHPVPWACLQRAYAGHDAMYVRQAHAAAPETVQDVFDKYGISVSKANIDRAAGSRSVRRALAADALVMVDTPGNRRLLNELRVLVPDVTRPETPRKVDASPDTGEGGDDGPDALRYAMATTPWSSEEPVVEPEGPKPDDPRKLTAPWAVAEGQESDIESHTPGQLGGFIDQFPAGY